MTSNKVHQIKLKLAKVLLTNEFLRKVQAYDVNLVARLWLEGF